MRTIRLTSLVLLVLPVMGAWAANPVLTAQVQGIKDSRKESADLRLASLENGTHIGGRLPTRPFPKPGFGEWPVDFNT